MRALEKSRQEKGLWLIDAPVPAPAKDEVQLRITGASICGTDLHIYNWDPWAQQRIRPPLIIGHEACGEVSALGKGVASHKVGDFVAVESHFPCRTCVQCSTGNMHLCQDMRIFGLDRNGAYADYTVVPALCARPVGDEIKHEYASLLEPLGNAVYVTLVEPVEGKSVAVYGCGPAGLFSVAVARFCGAREIFAVEPNATRQKLAKKAGATHVINPLKEKASDAIRAGTKGLGADIVLEMSGNEMAINDSLASLRRAGRYCFFGLPKGKVTLDISNGIIFKGARLYGITGRRMFETWETMADLLRKGLDITPLVTHSFRLEEFDRAFKVMETNDCGKVMLRV